MADTQFAGFVTGNRKIPGLASIKYALPGYQFDHATNAGNFGLRTNASNMEVKAFTVTDTANREIGPHGYDVEIKVELLQSRIHVELQNLYYLSKNIHQLLVQTVEDEYFNFILNGGTLAVPTGTRYVGCKWKFVMSETERKIEVTWTVRLTPLEVEWLYANTNAASVGGASGSFTGMTAQTLNRASGFKIANFEAVLINGNNVGRFNAPKIEIEVDGVKDTDMRTTCEHLAFTTEVSVLQTALTELQAGRTAAQNDYSLEYRTKHSEFFIWNAGTLSITPTVTIGDKDRMIKLVGKGRVPMSTLGVAFATDTLTCSLVGY